MTNPLEYLKRHQLVAHLVLIYGFTCVLLVLFQPLYLKGERIVAPLISLGIFAPALVSIGLSALLRPSPRQGSILVTALIHPAMNTTGNFLNASIGALLLLLLFTVFVVVLDKMWRRLPENNQAICQTISAETT